MVNKQLFVFGEELVKDNKGVYVFSNYNDYAPLNNNIYVKEPSKVLIANKNLQDYLDLLDDGLITKQDYNELLEINEFKDSNYIREVTSYDIDKNIMCSIAKGSNFDEFFLEDKNNTNNRYSKLLYNLDDFREIDIKSFSNEYVVDTLITKTKN